MRYFTAYISIVHFFLLFVSAVWVYFTETKVEIDLDLKILPSKPSAYTTMLAC